MTPVAIVGAGPIGGALALSLVSRGLVRHVRLVDELGTAARALALDIHQSGPPVRSDTCVTGTGDIDAVAGVGVVVLADEARSGREWRGEPGLVMLARVVKAGPGAVVVLAGSDPAWIMERALSEIRLPAARMVGTSPIAFEAGARAVAALEAGVPAGDVDLRIAGRIPSGVVVLWSLASVAGEPAVARLSDAARRRVEARLASLWPPGPQALASAAARACHAIGANTGRTMTCMVVGGPDGPGPGRAVALPTRLGETGVLGVRMPGGSPREQIALSAALDGRWGSMP
jgi:L-lactate dehydrogenase